MDETRLFVFKMWRIVMPTFAVCMMPGYIDMDAVNAWAWVSLGAFVVISGMLWLRRLPPSAMWLLLLLANVAGVIDSWQGRHFATGAMSVAVACACVWWAWRDRNDPSEHVIVKRLAEGGEG